MNRKLFYVASGLPVQKGDLIHLDGRLAEVRGMREGFVPHSTGRVYLAIPSADGETHLEYYPSVIGAEWSEVAIDKQVGEPLEKVSFSYSAYPENIMHTVREDLGLDMLDSSQDDIIDQMSRDEIFDRILNYNGLINHGDLVRQWVNDIYSIDLTDTN